jgi:hypothetical protein
VARELLKTLLETNPDLKSGVQGAVGGQKCCKKVMLPSKQGLT